METPTPRFDALLRALAFKLRDPVSNLQGTEDGKIFKLDSKINYINRGYGAMRRKIGSLLSSPEKVFSDYYRITQKDVKYNGNNVALTGLMIELSDIIPDDSVFDLKDIYLTVHDSPTATSGAVKQASQIDPESYISARYGGSKVYAANDEAGLYYWSVINGNIVFIAEDKYVSLVIMFYKNITPEFEHAGDKDLIIPREYNDFLLTCAAYEAMIDLGDNKAINKAVMYDKWLKNEMEVLMLKEKMTRMAEDDRTTK